MAGQRTLAVLAILTTFQNVPGCRAMSMSGRPGTGLIGYGIPMYYPPCAFACRAVISASPLACTEKTMDMDGDEHMHMSETSPACYATDNAFLQTLASCMQSHCGDTNDWKLEKYWQLNVPGQEVVQPDPKWTYQEALSKINATPTDMLVLGDPLNRTSRVAEEDYLGQLKTMTTFESVESNHSTYGLVLLASGAALPIALSLLRFLPIPRRVVTKVNAVFVDPPLFGDQHKVPVFFGTTIIPTRGQAIFILYLITINVVLSAVGYPTAGAASTWYSSPSQEILIYFGNRCGVLSFANVPLLMLYVGRNNFLYWVTNWSQSTFMILHRWVATICTLQACLHSLVYLRDYLAQGSDVYNEESNLSYWYWGIIGTLCMAILLPASVLPLRRKLYELFLACHVVLAILALLGCYFHIYYRFAHQWGYETWIYVAFAVWAFDRAVRILRLAQSGVRRAIITVLDEHYVRVDIQGVAAKGHAYVYFPTLSWRVWENHPFSVVSSCLMDLGTPSCSSASPIHQEKDSSPSPSEKTAGLVSTARPLQTTTKDATIGTTFFVRTLRGTTCLLRQCECLPVLVESSYLAHGSFHAYASMVCIAGGVGITALIHPLRSHLGARKLYWSTCSRSLAQAVAPLLGNVERDVLVNKRFDIAAVVREEAETGTGPMIVLVSGPHAMADAVRNAVTKIARHSKREIKLIEESFSW